MPQWDAEQRRNAAVIIQVGREMGMSKRDITIGLMTALQESTLRNLNYGDRDSLGLFQQRPSQGWGSPEQVTDPYYASKKFYEGLKGVAGRDKMSLTAAAQAVQRSAYPDAYAKHEEAARALLSEQGGKIQPKRRPTPTTNPIGDVTGLGVTATPGSVDTAPGLGAAQPGGAASAPGLAASTEPVTGMQAFGNADEYVNAAGGKAPLGQKGVNGTRRAIVELAQQYKGTPYVWGGTDLNSGVDCSGFIQSVYKEMGIDIPRVSYQQASYGKRTDLSNLKAGDLVAWDNSSRNNGADHIAIYLGNGRIIEAPRPGLGVRVRKLRDGEGAWGVAMDI